MIYKMKINEKAFMRMEIGDKKREYRINDFKRRNIKVGDVIEFSKLPDLKDKILMEVLEKEVYKSLDEAISVYFEEDFSSRYDSIESAVSSFYNKGYASRDEVIENGIVVFKIKKYKTSI